MSIEYKLDVEEILGVYVDSNIKYIIEREINNELSKVYVEIIKDTFLEINEQQKLLNQVDIKKIQQLILNDIIANKDYAKALNLRGYKRTGKYTITHKDLFTFKVNRIKGGKFFNRNYYGFSY